MRSSFWIFVLIIAAVAVLIIILTKRPVKAPIQSVKIENNGRKAVSGSGEYVVNTEESVLVAQGKRPLIPGYTDVGSIKIKEGAVEVSDGKITGIFKIDMNSLSVKSTAKKTGETMLERHLKSADFFDVEKYPESVFELKSAEKTPDDELYTVSGDLTIKGITKPISFPAVIYMRGGKLIAEGAVELDRTLFDVRYGSGKFFQNLGDNLISDIFLVEFSLSADPK